MPEHDELADLVRLAAPRFDVPAGLEERVFARIAPAPQAPPPLVVAARPGRRRFRRPRSCSWAAPSPSATSWRAVARG